MESVRSEELLTGFGENLAALLDNVSDLGAVIHKNSSSLLQKINKVDSADVNNLEGIGIKMIKLLTVLNINVIDIIQSLEKDVKKINENRNEKLLTNLHEKILEYKKSIAAASTSNNEDIKPKLLDKNTQTDYHDNVPNNDTQENKENVEIKSEKDVNTSTDRDCEITNFPTTSDLKLSKSIHLGLRRSDTQDTDDCWVDSINRTALELFDRKQERGKIDATDEHSDQLKEEQCEDEWDRKTEDLNYDSDKQLSSDDTFVDGKSPKAENMTDATSESQKSVPMDEANIGHIDTDSKNREILCSTNSSTKDNSLEKSCHSNETAKNLGDTYNHIEKLLRLKDDLLKDISMNNNAENESNIAKETNTDDTVATSSGEPNENIDSTVSSTESIPQKLASDIEDSDDTQNKKDSSISSSVISQTVNIVEETNKSVNIIDSSSIEPVALSNCESKQIVENDNNKTVSATNTEVADTVGASSAFKDQHHSESDQNSKDKLDTAPLDSQQSEESNDVPANLDKEKNISDSAGGDLSTSDPHSKHLPSETDNHSTDVAASSTVDALPPENPDISPEIDSQTPNIDGDITDLFCEESIFDTTELYTQVLNHSENDLNSSKVKCNTDNLLTNTICNKENLDEASDLKEDSNKLSELVDCTQNNPEKDLTPLDGQDTSSDDQIQGDSDETTYSQQTVQLNENLTPPQSEKSDTHDSDETDFEDNTDKLSELPSQTLDCSRDDNALKPTADNVKTTEETVTEVEDQETSSELNKQRQNENRSNAETFTESSCDKVTKNLAEVEGSSKNNESVADLGDNTNEHVNSTKELRDLEEDSCHSSKSFIFDVSSTYSKSTEQNVKEVNGVKVLKTDNEDSESTDHVKGTIEIFSDSDSDEVHLDVTMEEIVSTGYEEEEKVNLGVKKEENEEVVEDLKPIILEENVREIKNEEYDQYASRVIGDELLELLREVEVPSITPLTESKKTIQKTDNNEDIKKADEIFKMLQDESFSDISDSEISNSVSFSDVDLFEDKSSDKLEAMRGNEELIVGNMEKLKSAFSIKDCYISLKRLELEADAVDTVHKKLNDSVDRLCDIDNLLAKRKHGDSGEKPPKSKKVRKSDASEKGTSDSESLSDSDSDDAPHNNRTFSTTFDAPIEQKLDDLLANQICKTFKDNSSNQSTDVDSDDSDKTNEAKNRDKGKTVYDKRKKHLLTKEERKKKSWRNDPLLREKLTSDESTDSSSDQSDSGKSNKRRNILKTKYEYDSDFAIVTDDDDSDDSNAGNPNKIQLENKIVSPIKRNVPSDSTDTDSDIEIVTPKNETPEKQLATGEQESGPSSSQKGRRNIRALMSDESLAEATQRANKEEQERIERLENRSKMIESLSQSFSQIVEEDELILDIDDVTGEPLVKVHPLLNRRLKPHQKSGIQFMWDSCYESLKRLKLDDGSGCILAHCMGLGKTFQVLALLHTLFSQEETNTKHVLVVCPTSTVNNWKKEVKIVFKKFVNKKFEIVTIVSKKELSQKYGIVKKWQLSDKCVLVLGYETFETLTNELKLEKLGQQTKRRMLEALIDPGPDLVVCDEGHLLRNKKALKTLALNKIKTKRRIVLTGTPLQNNLLEYYYMVNFVKPNLLGTMKEYKTNFVNPITNGQYEDSTAEDIKLMMKRTHVLHKLLKKTIQRVEDTELKMYLPRMIDHAVFVQLHPIQVELYNKFSKLVEKNSTKTNRRGFLSDFSVFQYICTHPHLLSVMENLRNKRIKERDLITNDEDNPMCNIEGWWKAIVPADAKDNIQYGNKLMVLKSIIEECEEIGDKVLVFSQCLGEMDLIEHFLEKLGTAQCPSWKKGIDYCRMDGTVVPALRSAMCDLFNDNDNKKLRLLLMSTRVGGLGLNLTAANRVIIMTVNWNPSYDIQSVFRVYRFGQKKEVYVYRLIALDSMEEKVYQRTVTKLAIAHRVIDKHQITRHYKSMDLQELYSCRPSADIERPISNVPEDKVLAKLILKLPYIFKHHEHRALLANRPEDNLNEQELNAAWDEFKRIKDAPLAPPAHQPPPTQPVPQMPIVNGPTYSMAYDLVKPTTVNTNKETDKTTGNGGAELSLHLAQKSSEALNELRKKIQSAGTRILKQISKIPPSTTVSLEDGDDPSMIPIYGTTKNTEQDPLYIPLSRSNNSNRSYNDMLVDLTDKQFAVPKLLPDTTIILEPPSDNNNQREKRYYRKLSDAPKNGSVVIDLENEPSRDTSQSIGNGAPWTTRIKRKRNESSDKRVVLKKMRDRFNNAVSHVEPISIDDDDDVTEIADTTSESGSLSNELITNLGRSGITIHKVIKDSKKNDAIITLD